MARHLLVFLGRADQHTAAAAAAPPLIVLLLVVVVVVVIAAVVVSLCTSSTHAKLWNKRRGTSTSAPAPAALKLQEEAEGAASRKHLLSSLSGIGGRAAAMAKMVSWNRRSPAQVDDEEAAAGLTSTEVDEEALWRKDILMGVKCRPLEFSGSITFDCDGNQLPSTPPQPPAAPVASMKKADIAEA